MRGDTYRKDVYLELKEGRNGDSWRAARLSPRM